MKILIVEDEDSIREVEAAYIRQSNYISIEARDGKEALDLFELHKPDLVILDLNIPHINGIEVCKKIRASSQVPIIMVTAKVEEIDELIGLESGADDYIKKPFSPTILLARIKTLLRRFGDTKINFKDLEIDPERMNIICRGEKIVLTTTQFNILYTLAQNPGKVFTRSEILDRAYDESLPPDVLDRTVDAHIKSIRKFIEVDTKKPKYIQTVIGKGYKFNDLL